MVEKILGDGAAPAKTPGDVRSDGIHPKIGLGTSSAQSPDLGFGFRTARAASDFRRQSFQKFAGLIFRCAFDFRQGQ